MRIVRILLGVLLVATATAVVAPSASAGPGPGPGCGADQLCVYANANTPDAVSGPWKTWTTSGACRGNVRRIPDLRQVSRSGGDWNDLIGSVVNNTDFDFSFFTDINFKGDSFNVARHSATKDLSTWQELPWRSSNFHTASSIESFCAPSPEQLCPTPKTVCAWLRTVPMTDAESSPTDPTQFVALTRNPTDFTAPGGQDLRTIARGAAGDWNDRFGTVYVSQGTREVDFTYHIANDWEKCETGQVLSQQDRYVQAVSKSWVVVRPGLRYLAEPQDTEASACNLGKPTADPVQPYKRNARWQFSGYLIS